MDSILTSILAVFTAIGEWISTAVTSVSAMFYAEGALTLLGTLAVAGLGFSVIFLLIGVISNFLHFRG